MKVARTGGIYGPIFVLPDGGGAPLAGPFATTYAAKFWIVEQVEAGLSDVKRAIWAEVSRRLGTLTADLGLELFLVEQVARGKTLAQVTKYLPHRFERRDPKALASGEAAA